MNETLEKGYYKVKYAGHWEIAELDTYGWYMSGVESQFEENDFEEIGDRIELPD